MIKQSLAVVAVLAMVGCASQSNTPATQSQMQASNSASAAPGQTQPELAAYAGAHQYPTSEPAKNDIRAAAIVSTDQGVIKIYNFGTQPIRDANVWVNQAYVRHVPAISPGTSVSIPMGNLYNGLGQQFAAQGEHVNLVQIEQDHDLETLMGPAPQ
jgi:hypothetical protein